MNNERLRSRLPMADEGGLSFLTMPTIALVALTACTPSGPDDGNVGQAADTIANEATEEPVTRLSALEALLLRLGEPPLAENCAADTTIYRVSRLDWEEGAAAVRVFSGPDDEHGYRSVFSPALGQAISSDGWLDDRTWDGVEAQIRNSDFWNIESDEFADEQYGGVMFVEGCKDGEYHYIESEPEHFWLDGIVNRFSRIGKLQWLETGVRDFSER